MLEKLDEDTVYIVGGLVDRNNEKNVTLEKAESLGIRHAWLPLKEHIDLKMCPVLTVNQVFKILAE